jgi:hypothetical protein
MCGTGQSVECIGFKGNVGENAWDPYVACDAGITWDPSGVIWEICVRHNSH